MNEASLTQTIAIDFDGVVHKYSKGWHDGSIYDEAMPGAFDAIHRLMKDYAVFIHTTRDPQQVREWLRDNCQYSIPTFIAHHEPFWNIQGFLLITNKKYPAVAYIDDRAIRFIDWPQALSDVAKVA